MYFKLFFSRIMFFVTVEIIAIYRKLFRRFLYAPGFLLLDGTDGTGKTTIVSKLLSMGMSKKPYNHLLNWPTLSTLWEEIADITQKLRDAGDPSVGGLYLQLYRHDAGLFSSGLEQVMLVGSFLRFFAWNFGVSTPTPPKGFLRALWFFANYPFPEKAVVLVTDVYELQKHYLERGDKTDELNLSDRERVQFLTLYLNTKFFGASVVNNTNCTVSETVNSVTKKLGLLL
jgi:hypothetical protein